MKKVFKVGLTAGGTILGIAAISAIVKCKQSSNEAKVEIARLEKEIEQNKQEANTQKRKPRKKVEQVEAEVIDN